MPARRDRYEAHPWQEWSPARKVLVVAIYAVLITLVLAGVSASRADRGCPSRVGETTRHAGGFRYGKLASPGGC